MTSTFRSINPADGTLVAEFPSMGAAEVQTAIKSAEEARLAWLGRAHSSRSADLLAVANLLETRAAQLAHTMAIEMGKPIQEGQAEARKCAWACRYFADHAFGMLAEETTSTDKEQCLVCYRPLGLILAIMPWNFPLWQVFRFAAPALMAGNGILLKHAPSVTLCAKAIIEIFRDAGVPDNLCSLLLAENEMLESITAHPAVRGVTFTGSTRTGRVVAATAGRHLKKCVLELGGSDAYLILDDADIPLAAKACATSRMINGGQSCIAAKRFIVTPAARDKFEKQFSNEISRFTPADPLEPSTNLGPLARPDIRDNLHRQVTESLRMGARLVRGGVHPGGPGNYYPASILADVRPGMPVFEEETFGPVAAIIHAEDTGHAVALANASAFGLGAALFTRDMELAGRLARESLECGCAAINDFVRSDPRLPFGGIKDSGFGRELGPHGMREWTNVKTITGTKA